MTALALPKTFLVPVDFSTASERALDHAILLAQKLDAKIVVLHSYELPVIGLMESTFVLPAEVAAQLQDASSKGLAALVARKKASFPRIEGVLHEGEPSAMILKTATETGADTIVMGTHGRRGLSRALLGSVTEKIVRSSPVPVLTVRGDDGKT
ncbi:MAG: universal stress protein [Polyangiaceae bacterium]